MLIRILILLNKLLSDKTKIFLILNIIAELENELQGELPCDWYNYAIINDNSIYTFDFAMCKVMDHLRHNFKQNYILDISSW